MESRRTLILLAALLSLPSAAVAEPPSAASIRKATDAIDDQRLDQAAP